MVNIGQTITVVNKSGKIVSTSKHIVNVFKDAKAAYLEKKAELRQAREAEFDERSKASHRSPRPRVIEDDARSVNTASEGRPRGPARRVSDEDDVRSTTSHRSTRSHRSSHSNASHTSRHSKRAHGTHSSGHREKHHTSSRGHKEERGSHAHSHSHRDERSHRSSHRPGMERGFSDSMVDSPPTNLPRRASTKPLSTSPLHHSFTPEELARQELSRRKSESDGMREVQIRRKPVPPRQAVDMDLAYGDLPPPLPVARTENAEELRGKMTALQRMLEEANCVQHSATAIIKNLESNPEAMAAVALTLAEISNLASKLAPGALMSLKGAFPAVMALLISPEFLIAAGLGVGVTVIAFGSYKIIKKIRAKKAIQGKDGTTHEMLIEDEMVAEGDELESVHTDIDRIEQWRRGIAVSVDDSAVPGKASAATSVEGEFMTPGAATQLRNEGVLPPKKSKKAADGSTKTKKKVESGKKRGLFSRREVVIA